MLPTDQQIIDLHHKYAKTDADFQLVYQHCQIIEAVAMQLLDANPVAGIDRQLVHVGCMLHDIGAYKVLENGFFVNGVRHGVFGEEILKEEGYPEKLWRIASHHTGVGLTEQDVIDQSLPIPVADYTAQTNEERLVMYADKFHSKGKPPYFCSYEWFHESVQKFGKDKAAKLDALAALFKKPDLTPLSQRFGHEIKTTNA